MKKKKFHDSGCLWTRRKKNGSGKMYTGVLLNVLTLKNYTKNDLRQVLLMFTLVVIHFRW